MKAFYVKEVSYLEKRMKVSDRDFAQIEPYIVTEENVYVVSTDNISIYEAICQKFGVDKLESYGPYTRCTIEEIPISALTVRESNMVKEHFDNFERYGSALDFKEWMLNDVKSRPDKDEEPMKQFIEVITKIIDDEFDRYKSATGWLH